MENLLTDLIFNVSNNESNLSSVPIYSNPIVSYVTALTCVLALIFIFGLVFNFISIIAILKFKKLEPINILIFNLTLADIVYISGIPMYIDNVFKQSWPFELIGCRIFFMKDFVGMIVGVYSVVALSVERTIEVTDTKKNKESMSNRLKTIIAITYIIIIWIFAILFSLPMVLSFETGVSIDGSFMCDTKWTESELNSFFIIKYLFIFIIPFAIILVSSIKLLIFLVKWKNKSGVFLRNKAEEIMTRSNKATTSAFVSKYSQSVVNDDSPTILRRSAKFTKRKGKQKAKSRQIRDKAIKIVLSIILLFFLQWTPLWVFELIKATAAKNIENIHLINVIITIISYSNSITNPLLYIILTHKFSLIEILVCLKLIKKN